MTSKDIFSNISNRMVKGLMFHNDYADIMCFMGLSGFKRLNECQYKAESDNMRKIHRYFLESHNMLLDDNRVEVKSEIPSEWRSYSRMDIDANTKKDVSKTFLTKWLSWETETKNELEKAYIQLMEIGEVSDALEVKSFLCDVNHELKYATKLYLKFKVVDFDINTIIGMQDEIHKHFYKKEWKYD